MELPHTKWHVNSNGYVVNKNGSGDKTKVLRMHRVVMGLHGIQIPEDMEVDPIYANRLDNRFENLRRCNRSQNLSRKTLSYTKNWPSRYTANLPP